jgi:hypothetical protein
LLNPVERNDILEPSIMSDEFVFRPSDKIGSSAAEDDGEFLASCFVDNGVLDVLKEMADRRNLLVGRTGVGKSALVKVLEDSNALSIRIDPDQQVFQFVSCSNVVPWPRQQGVALQPVFKQLWRHVLVCEIVKSRVGDSESFRDRFVANFPGTAASANRAARDSLAKYVDSFGAEFWLDSEAQARRWTEKLEESVSAGLEGKGKSPLGDATARADHRQVSSVELQTDEVQRIQRVVANDLVAGLKAAFASLHELTARNAARPCYVLVDQLDRDWAEESVQLELVRALIDVSFEFNAASNTKVILCLRRDLLNRTYDRSRQANPGFQQEKYEDHVLEVRWTSSELLTLLNKRVEGLVKTRYTKNSPPFSALIPVTVNEGERPGDRKPGKSDRRNSVDGTEYFIRRTLLRPRDAIAFFNACIKRAAGSPKINAAQLKEAEREYSAHRLTAVCDEWRQTYPGLQASADCLLRGRSSSFLVAEWTDTLLDDYCGRVAPGLPAADSIRIEVDSQPGDFLALRRLVARMLYDAGLVALKSKHSRGSQWSFAAHDGTLAKNLTGEWRVQVHPAFWMALDVAPER